MRAQQVSFSIVSHAAWAPGISTPEAWIAWAAAPFPIVGDDEPGVRAMAPMLRRRAGALGKMALEVAYQCLDGRSAIPTVFCSRHGEAARAIALLSDLVNGEGVSPTGFGLAVHNASAGLFSIARADQANHLALAAGPSTVEHAVIEACSLLADGEPMVLLVAYDHSLPALLSHFEDCAEQPHAWAWLITKPGADPLHLSWSAAAPAACAAQSLDVQAADVQPASLEVLRFQLSGARAYERVCGRQRWQWRRDA